MRFITAFLLTLPSLMIAQITPAQQKSLNAYVEYANQSADEVTQIVTSIIEYYPKIERKNSITPRYVCPFQMDPYYLNNAESLKRSLVTAISASIDLPFKNLREAEEKVDLQCKALD